MGRVRWALGVLRRCRPLEVGDFLIREFEIGRNPDFAFRSARNARRGRFLWHRHKLDEGLAVAGDDDFLTGEGAFNEAR